MMHEVALNGLTFKAYHGYYEEERARGNQFSVDIAVQSNFEKAAKGDDLAAATDYEQLYAIVKEEMQISASLLENVVYRIAQRVLDEMQTVELVKVSLAKVNPPIKGQCREARVTIEKNRI